MKSEYYIPNHQILLLIESFLFLNLKFKIYKIAFKYIISTAAKN